jgi:hypothetical protein
MKSSNLVIPKDENGPETEAEMHAEETRRAVEGSKSTPHRSQQAPPKKQGSDRR